jgi:hypothetical protein
MVGWSKSRFGYKDHILGRIMLDRGSLNRTDSPTTPRDQPPSRVQHSQQMMRKFSGSALMAGSDRGMFVIKRSSERNYKSSVSSNESSVRNILESCLDNFIRIIMQWQLTTACDMHWKSDCGYLSSSSTNQVENMGISELIYYGIIDPSMKRRCMHPTTPAHNRV